MVRNFFFISLLSSVGDLHRFDAGLDSDPTFHLDADPYPNPTSSFTPVGKSEKIVTFIDSSASLHCLSCSSAFDSVLNFRKKV
jgi:hypothetical protein